MKIAENQNLCFFNVIFKFDIFTKITENHTDK